MSSLQIETTKPRKVPVSLRLPPQTIEHINVYAQQKGISRTDAYLHFIEKGMESEDKEGSTDAITALYNDIAEIKAMLCGQESKPASSHEAYTELEPSTNFIASSIVHASEKFPAIKRAYLFGSFARNTATENSDIDVRIELAEGESFTLHDLDHYSKIIEQDVGRDVDVVSARTIKNEPLRKAIEREGVLLYERKK